MEADLHYKAPQYVRMEITDTEQLKDIHVCDDAILIGLHTCGNLASLSIRMFLESKARALVNVGCCYQALTPHHVVSPDDRLLHGFPLSTISLSSGLQLTQKVLETGMTRYRHFSCES